MIENNIYIRVKFADFDEYLPFLIENNLNIELYLSSDILDRHTDEDIIKIRDLCNEHNVKTIIHAPFSDMSPGGLDLKVRNITIERFINIIYIAKTLNASSIVYHPGYDDKRQSSIYEQWLQNSIDTWTKVMTVASKKNITISIENIFERKPDSLLDIINKISMKTFGHCFDTGHFTLFSDIDLENWIHKMAPHIREFHLHNNYGLADNHNSLEDGIFDFSKLFKLIVKYKLDAKLTIEVKGFEKISESVDRLLRN